MKRSIIALSTLIACTALNVNAQENSSDINESGFYLGGNYGYLRVEGEDSFDDNKDVWQGIVGYKFNTWVAVEGSYIDFGDYGTALSGGETDGYTAALKGMVPITSGLSAYAKVGQLWSETELRDDVYRVTQDDESVFVGAGLSFAFSPSWVMNAEYVVYDTELDGEEIFEDIDDTNFETDLKQASIGIEYRF